MRDQDVGVSVHASTERHDYGRDRKHSTMPSSTEAETLLESTGKISKTSSPHSENCEHRQSTEQIVTSKQAPVCLGDEGRCTSNAECDTSG